MAKSNPLRFDVTTKTVNGNTFYEAVANIPGFSNANVTKIEDGTNRFSTRSAITSACNNRASSLGMTAVIRYAGEQMATPAGSTTTAARAVKKTARTRTAAAKR
jgi:hypothetical protein